ncbi:MAG TPA: hypothetical protein VMP01_03400 [Pirellulaceae bacterium]|nr:hypothetical protein [Pirellulaceae bacterium]
MNARLIVVAAVLLSLPGLVQAQVSCSKCSHSSVIRPASADLWAGYEQAPDCGGCGICRRCCDPCCTPLLCVVPNTLRRIGRTLDCLLPCGPRSGHGCGISCIGAGSGCMGGCGRPGIFHPNKCCDTGCGDIAPPMYKGPAGLESIPPAPQPSQETRRAPAGSPHARTQSRQLTAGSVALKSTTTEPAASARPIGSGVSQAEHLAPVVNKKPASVLKRISYEEEISTPKARTNWPKAMDSIPHNPLR